MTAREYLREFETLGTKVRNLKEAIDRLHALAGPHSPLLTGMPKATPQVTSAMEKAMTEALALEEELAVLEDRYEAKRTFLIICIAQISDDIARQVIQYLYIDQMSVSDLLTKFNYSDTRIRTAKYDGLKSLNQILQKQQSTP